MKKREKLLSNPIFQLVLVALVTWIGLFFLTPLVSASSAKSGGSNAQTNKQIVFTLLAEGFGKGDKTVINKLVREDYIQHNPTAADRREGLLQLVDMIKAGKVPAPKVDVKRVIADGDYVLLHSDYDWGGRKAVFDLFRVQDGMIAEHWDCIQAQPQKTASGHTMLDGPTEITDRDKTAANKQLVGSFMETILLKGQFDKMHQYFDDDKYIQHNPMVPDGLSGLLKALEEMGKQGIKMEYHKVHRIIGEGNFVLVQSEGTFAGKPTAFYDLFRIKDGKIAEHWDVIQEIPDKMPHNNGMF